MPHFPIFTGNIKSFNAEKVKYILKSFGSPEKKLKNESDQNTTCHNYFVKRRDCRRMAPYLNSGLGRLRVHV